MTLRVDALSIFHRPSGKGVVVGATDEALATATINALDRIVNAFGSEAVAVDSRTGEVVGRAWPNKSGRRSFGLAEIPWSGTGWQPSGSAWGRNRVH